MPIHRAALLMALTTALPPIVRHMRPAVEEPSPTAERLADDVIASIDRIAGMGPSLLVWNECERLRAAAHTLAHR